MQAQASVLEELVHSSKCGPRVFTYLSSHESHQVNVQEFCMSMS